VRGKQTWAQQLIEKGLHRILGPAGLQSLLLSRPEYRFINSESTLLAQQHQTPAKGNEQGISSLDLGCGTEPRNPFNASDIYGIDIRTSSNPNILTADLFCSPIPFEDAKFDFVTAYDFIEHIPRTIVQESTRFPFVELMSEIHRVLKPGGLFYSHTPAHPFKQAYQDPTHVNIITEDTFPIYFCDNEIESAFGRAYGFNGRFKLVDQCWLSHKLLTLLRKY
jgi:SAM-dependent methyltransferase